VSDQELFKLWLLEEFMSKGPEGEILKRIAKMGVGEAVTLGTQITGTDWAYQFIRTDGGRLDFRMIHVSGTCEFSTVGNPNGDMLFTHKRSE
jgi:hypothetical protein